MNSKFSLTVLGVAWLVSTAAMPRAAAEPAPSVTGLSASEQAAVFKAAGAVKKNGKWLICADDPNPDGAAIESVLDLNGDGRPEALVSESGTYCYGNTGTGYKLLSRDADGRWRMMAGGTGIAEFLKTRGVGNWPDISVGGPGFCFPVERWNGKAYVLNRFEYGGKRCKPPR